MLARLSHIPNMMRLGHRLPSVLLFLSFIILTVYIYSRVPSLSNLSALTTQLNISHIKKSQSQAHLSRRPAQKAAILPISNVSATTIPPVTQSSPIAIPTPFTEKRYDSIFYYKTHKTGSSTLAHHLYKYLSRFQLTSLRAPGHIFMRTLRPEDGPPRVDAVIMHHMLFDRTLIESYLKKPPNLLITSLRLPLQRQISWFRQQNRHHEYKISNQSQSCTDTRNTTLLE